MAAPRAFLRSTAAMAATGALGVATFEALRGLGRRLPLRQAGVTATALGLRGVRKAEVAAERTRLAAADVLAEARERIGEEAPPPVADAAHDHDH